MVEGHEFPEKLPERLTVGALAIFLGKSTDTIRRWVRERRIATVKTLGRVYITRDEAQRLRSLPDVPAPADPRDPRDPSGDGNGTKKKGRER